MIRGDLCHNKSDMLVATGAQCQVTSVHIFLLLQKHLSQTWRHTEAHKSAQVTTSTASWPNCIIKLIVSAINFNPDMKEMGGRGGYVTNYSHILQLVFKDMCVVRHTGAVVDGG